MACPDTRPLALCTTAHWQHHGLTEDAPRQNDPIRALQPKIADQAPAVQNGGVRRTVVITDHAA
jgi:hypothetical protein